MGGESWWGAHSLMKCCASSWLRKARGPCVTDWTRLSSCWQSLRVMASTLSGGTWASGHGGSGQRVGEALPHHTLEDREGP